MPKNANMAANARYQPPRHFSVRNARSQPLLSVTSLKHLIPTVGGQMVDVPSSCNAISKAGSVVYICHLVLHHEGDHQAFIAGGEVVTWLQEQD